MKEFNVSFPGGKRVNAEFDGFTVETDQSLRGGGQASAPTPFDYFFVSMVTCVGISVLEYCSDNGISSEGLGTRLTTSPDRERRLYSPIRIEVTLPPGFPDAHRDGILAEANSCTVKRHIVDTPELETVLIDA